MTALERAEIQPGVVVQLDVDALSRSGRSRTNAERTEQDDRAVVGEHSFLVLKLDDTRETAFATPLFSAWAPGSEQLNESLKSGHPGKWIGVVLHFNRWQHWEIALDELVAKSQVEDTEVGSRRRYAADAPAELARILSFADRNRAPWRDT